MLAFVSPCLLFNLVILLFIINNYESLWTRQFWASFSHTLSALTILYYQPLLSWLEEGPVRHLLKVTRAHMLILQLYCFSQTSITQISCLGKSVYWGYLSYFWISFSKKKKNSEKEEENSRYRQQLCSVGNTLLPGWWTIKRHWWVSFRDNRHVKSRLQTLQSLLGTYALWLFHSSSVFMQGFGSRWQWQIACLHLPPKHYRVWWC